MKKKAFFKKKINYLYFLFFRLGGNNSPITTSVKKLHTFISPLTVTKHIFPKKKETLDFGISKIPFPHQQHDDPYGNLCLDVLPPHPPLNEAGTPLERNRLGRQGLGLVNLESWGGKQ